MSDDLFDIDEKQKLSREAAAAKLRELADAIASNNSVRFEKAGKTITVDIPAEVELKVEVELGDENELEIELTW
ncbi:amphi-Trp domain-containing protein [Nocardioides yefusunii]|uniref:Amphi-Trp domain-containing protein n=1 Tax=Nocardioides yefusunii TaxID=2500546 RepID=A0ABW1R0S2_9ACTN|nr:amphi-Trp domain-containing protein [Nocardioides yefusunii]